MGMNMLVDSNVIIDYVSNRIPEKSAKQLDNYLIEISRFQSYLK